MMGVRPGVYPPSSLVAARDGPGIMPAMTMHAPSCDKYHTAAGFAGVPPEFRDPATARIAVLPVPYDATSTWKKGADLGPAAIIAASSTVEFFDIPTGTEVYRRGIVTLPPIAFAGNPERLADLVDEQVREVLQRDQFPVVLGGEHSVSIGAVRAVAAAHPRLSVLQIDAHGDTRETYEGSRFNHACVMARVREWCPIVQVGIRAIEADEHRRMDLSRVFFAHDIMTSPTQSWMDRVVGKLTDDVYVTIDLDGFDPAYVPATGTPEPGGLSWHQVDALLRKVVAKRNVVGFDVVELLPAPGLWASEFFAAKLVYRFLSEIFAQGERKSHARTRRSAPRTRRAAASKPAPKPRQSSTDRR
jgi:agmatinase